MNEEIKKKFEAMARALGMWGYEGCDKDHKNFMAGAKAAWELAHQPSEDDERDAYLAYIESEFDTDFGFTAGFLSGRKGLHQAVEQAVKKERQRIANEIQCMSKGRQDVLNKILNPEQ